MGMIGCPLCSYEPYDPEALCPNCGARARGTPEPEPEPEPAKPGIVLRLLPPPAASDDARRTHCRRILLEALQRIEAGEIEELVLLTINSKQSSSPYTLRWQFVDPVRMSGLLHYGAQHFASPPFVHMG